MKVLQFFKNLFHQHRWEFVRGDWIKGHEGKVSLTVRGCACGLHQEMCHYKDFAITFLEREWHEPLTPKYPQEPAHD